LRRQCLNTRIATIDDVAERTANWVAQRNAYQSGINWRFTSKDARIKLKRLYPVVNVQKST